MESPLYLLILVTLDPHLCTAQWCYQSQYSCDHTCGDPSRWAAQFPRCGGLRQSPINIVTRKVHVNAALPPFDFIGHTTRNNITVKNKGHSGEAESRPAPAGSHGFFLAAHFELPQSVRLTGGALPGHYRAAQFHFHWGGSGRPGSEHTIDGERFPMEMHIVHIKEPYGSLVEAEHDMAGIALLAFLFEESTDDHPHLDTVITALGRVPNNGSSSVVPNFRLSDIVPPSKELRGYYRYVGSMTTPGCEQAVAWTVFRRTLPISSRQVSPPRPPDHGAPCVTVLLLPLQLDALVKQCRFWTGQPMTDIFRPTQPLDGRVVYRSNSGGALTTGAWTGVLALLVGMSPVML
ncbi:carbonic anhydrase 4-like isoform X1 [Synchiropus splendidus]|uniref:carbonic anhydrase 4-like isoform X1 n=1 Tax=Synchiropus splendidus TaxID=270530 RepID=UPI00237D44F1|nr:carbonic anhydrase 4-like isoform X1 [Synchiropus splendidus]